MSFSTSADIQYNSFGYWKTNKKSNSSTFVPLGNAVLIDSITSNIETNNARLLLSFQYMGEPKHVTINRSDFGDSSLIQTLAGKGADITKKNFDFFIDTLRQQEESMLQAGRGVTKVYTNLGWIPLPVLNGEGMQIGTKLHYRADHLLGGYQATYDGPYSVIPAGSFSAWRDMVVKDVVGNTPMEIILLAGLAAVVNGLIGPITTGENPIYHICGCSSSGKSTALSLCASVSGVPYDGERRGYNNHGEITVRRSIYGNWSSTEAATTRQCAGNKGVVIILNELGKYREKDLSPVVYDLSDGVDKSRLDSKMNVYTAENYTTVIVSSGEISLLDHCRTKLEGLHNRVMEITDRMTIDAAHSRRIKDTCRKHNGWAAPALAQYILDNGGLKMVLSTYNSYCQSLQNKLPTTPSTDRFIEKFPALIMTTAELSSKALDIPFDTAGILDYFVRYESTHGQQRNISADSYRVVIEACRTNKKSFYVKGEPAPAVKSYGKITYPNKILDDGRIVVEEYAIRRSFLERVLDKNNFTNISTCISEWKSMGVLYHDADRPTRSRLIDKSAGKTEDVFVLRVFAEQPDNDNVKAVPKSKLVKRAFSPSPQLATMLNDDKEGEEDA